MSRGALLQQQYRAEGGGSPPVSGMILGAYVHQAVQSPYKRLDAFLDHLTSVGITELRPKAFQHLRWTGTWESGGPFDIEGIADVKRLQAVCAERGIILYPWIVPMGLDIEREAQLAAQVAHVCDRLDFDVEPYEEFWPGLAAGNTSNVEPYFARVRELVGPDVELTLDFPARDSAWEWGRIKPVVELAAPYMNRLALQSYFGLVQAMDAEHRVNALGTGLPIDHITDVPHLTEMLAAARQSDQTRLLIWREADLDAAADALLRGTVVPPIQPGTGPRLKGPVRELSQFSASSYDTVAEFNKIAAYACSAGALAAVLNGYFPERQYNITRTLALIKQVGDAVLTDAEARAIGSNGGGLQNRLGQSEAIARVLTHEGVPARTHEYGPLTREQFQALLPDRPIIAQMNNLHGGHYIAVKDADAAGLDIADSNIGAGKWTRKDWGTFWNAMAGGRAVWAD